MGSEVEMGSSQSQPVLSPKSDTETRLSDGLRQVLKNIAAVPSTHEELNYLYANVLHARGSLSKEIRREAVIAIKTYRDILDAVRDGLAGRPLGAEDGQLRDEPSSSEEPTP